MDKLRKTSVADLIRVWVDMMRANMQHTLEANATKWHSSLGYNKSIENIELVICEKLQITLLEAKIMLNSKKKVIDVKEKKLFKCKNGRISTKKPQKYLTKLTQGMGTINTELFHAHHAITKLDNLVSNDESEEEV